MNRISTGEYPWSNRANTLHFNPLRFKWYLRAVAISRASLNDMAQTPFQLMMKTATRIAQQTTQQTTTKMDRQTPRQTQSQMQDKTNAQTQAQIELGLSLRSLRAAQDQHGT